MFCARLSVTEIYSAYWCQLNECLSLEGCQSHHGIWNHWQNCLFNSLCKLTIKNTAQFPLLVLCERNPPVTDASPHNGQWCGKFFHVETSSCNLNSCHLHMDLIPPNVEPNIAITVATDVLAPNSVMPSASTVLSTKLDILVRLQKCSCLVTWFCYQMITKPGNKTAALSWPNPYMIQSYYQWLWVMFSWADNIIQNTCQNFVRYGDTSSIKWRQVLVSLDLIIN